MGINVLPHAVRELSELGLLDDLQSIGIPTAELVYYSRHGQRIWGEPRGLAAGYNWPQFSVHRGQLLTIVHRAVVKQLGSSRVHVGHHLARFGQQDGRVWGEFADRKTWTSVARAEADLLVACDGVHSIVRRTLYPSEGNPKWNGITMWRAITRSRPFLSGRTMIMVGHMGRRVVIYPISKEYEDRGEALINWVAEFKNAPERPMPRQDWEFTASFEEAVRPFLSFKFDFLDIPELMRGAEVIYQYPMVDRDPLPTWNHGRVTLLGDAAHPMYPVGSNGASQAILDARVLARELALQPTIEHALAAYDAQRRPATSAVVQANRGVGPERCMELVEQRAPNGFANLNDVVSQAEMEEISLNYKATAGFDPQTLNTRPSLSVPRPSGDTGKRP
jgi:2-polyprenyl-6-methoxyphenol hydroxylase-like FAD-dependent oxidoreductase